MSQRGVKDDWEHAAEKLVRRVRNLLDGHGEALQEALRKKLGEQGAAAEVDQLELMVRILEEELWRKSTADRSKVGWVVGGIKTSLKVVGVTVATLAATQVYQAVMAADDQAKTVAKCVVLREKPGEIITGPARTNQGRSAPRETYIRPYELPETPPPLDLPEPKTRRLLKTLGMTPTREHIKAAASSGRAPDDGLDPGSYTVEELREMFLLPREGSRSTG